MGGQGGRGRAGQLAGGGQRAALGEGEDAQRGEGEGRRAGKVHSVQPWKMKTWRRDVSLRRHQNNIWTPTYTPTHLQFQNM